MATRVNGAAKPTEPAITASDLTNRFDEAAGVFDLDLEVERVESSRSSD